MAGKQRANVKSVKKGLPEGYSRATFIVRDEYLNKLRAKAYWDRITIKEVVDEALAQYLGDKKIRSIPKR